jgi:peptidyl-prolyl cis-trans isomerase B (cyclophilin B)
VASKSDRRRQLAREHWERQQARRAERQRRARRRRRIALVITLSLAVLGLVVWGSWWLTGGGVGEDDFAVDTGPTASPSNGEQKATTCSYPETGSPAKGVGVPPANPGDMSGTWTATVTIGGKPVIINLAADRAPCAVASLNYLASKDYFDATACHRLTTAATLHVLQCGDPTGTGSGTPGYRFANENTQGATYSAGTVAMANSGGTDSNGSQFFIVYGETTLEPNFTVLGTVSSGLDVVQAIAAAGVAGGADDGAPSQTVTIDDLTVTRS